MDDEQLDSPGQRLRFARERAGYATAKSAAKKAGVGEVSWRAYENDQHGYSKHAVKIAKIVGMPVEWLLDGGPLPTEDPPAPGELAVPEELANHDIELVRKLDIAFAMGDGTIIDDYPAAEFLPFDLQFLRQFARGSTDRLFLATGHGESMEPTLRREDLVMIDTSQQNLTMQDQIWALSFAGAGMIKRLRRLADDKVLILSDNQSVPPQEVSAEDIHIVGKVVWIARTM